MESTLILSLRHWMIHDLVGSERGTYLKLCLAWSVFVWGTVVSIDSEPSSKNASVAPPPPPLQYASKLFQHGLIFSAPTDLVSWSWRPSMQLFRLAFSLRSPSVISGELHTSDDEHVLCTVQPPVYWFWNYFFTVPYKLTSKLHWSARSLIFKLCSFFTYKRVLIKCHIILLKTTNTTQKMSFSFFKLR